MKRAFLIIQGQGNGHLTQAISFCQQNNIVPKYVVFTEINNINANILEQFNWPYIGYVDTPKLVLENGKISIIKTVLNNYNNIPKYIKAYSKLNRWLKSIDDYDILINFYEPINNLIRVKDKPRITVSNQFLISTNDWQKPKLNINYVFIRLWNNLFYRQSDILYVPSFIKTKDYGKFRFIAPLIPNRLISSSIYNNYHYLIYLSGDQFKDDILNLVSKHPNKKFIWYVNNLFEHKHRNLILKNVGDNNFERDMLTCDTIITTAGYQMISEALYLGKKIYVIPLHYEQLTNAINLEYHSLGHFIKDTSNFKF